MLNQGQVGPLATTASLSAGTQPAFRLGNMQDLVTSEGRGRYYEPAYRKQMFTVAVQATGMTTTVGNNATYVGLCLANPINSSVNLVVNKVGLCFTVAFPAAAASAAAFGLMSGYNQTTNVTLTNAVSTKSNFFNNATVSAGVAAANATLVGQPLVTHIFGASGNGAITTLPSIIPSVIDLEGSLILPPGGYTAIYTSNASGTSSMWASFQWEEVPA